MSDMQQYIDQAADEAATILADRLDSELWDTNDALIEDPERRGVYMFWRTWDAKRGRGIVVEVEEHTRDEFGDIVDSTTIYTTTAWEFDEPEVDLDKLQQIAWRLEELRAEETRLVDERDDMIRAMRPQGMSLRMIAKMAGVSHMQVKNICDQ